MALKEAEIIDRAFEKAKEVLKKCSTKKGFYAAFPGYAGVWSRDSIITSIGASLIEEKFKETFKRSLITLAKAQSKKGQIPNAVIDKGAEYKSIDSTLWFVFGHYLYKQRYKDDSLYKKHKKNIDKALTWLSYQDMGEDLMLEQLPTTDWQDAFPHRYGHTINTQALYYKILNLTGKKRDAKKLRKNVNKNKDDKLWQENYYLPWRWKNHNKYKELGEWFDSLGNLLAIIFELADKEQSEKIFNHIKNKKINKPYPVKAIFPPIRPKTKEWQDYFKDCAAGKAYHYLNSGIWTFIGGFYICALVKHKKIKEAQKELLQLAKANLQKPFYSEWLNGKTGRPGISGDGSKDGNQAWNAGMYIAAYESVKKKKSVI